MQLYKYKYANAELRKINIIKINISSNFVQGVSQKGNPTLACHCALTAGCMNVIFARP